MRGRVIVCAFVLAGIAACARPAAPIDADGVLKAMSQKLADAKRVSFTVRREIDPDLLQGRDLQAQTTIMVRLARPNRIAIRFDSEGDKRAMYADGTTFTLQDVTKNIYSTIQLAATLDTLNEQLEKTYGFVPPLFEFVTNKPYESIHARANTITYTGEASYDSGPACHRLTVAGDIADAELCVGVKDGLPQQLVATFRNIASRPQLRMYFTEWNLAATFPDAELAFVAPAGAMKIPMRTVDEMQALVAAQGKKKGEK